ncbi:WapI family immunity protein [Stagnimonas aquatica]|uniref:WapI family immunity protein n=1 Tax=Stagnimonas aquatica TaxID=2689987 RepID=UPI0011CE18A2|nr:hypothetical protein [Stagnimonas aquatica]
MQIKSHGLDFELRLSRPDQEGWMSAAIEVHVPSVTCRFGCTIDTAEWSSFVDELQRLEAAIGKRISANWENMEENIAFTFVLEERGALSGTYKFSPNNFSLGPVVSGAFEADQTSLKAWVASARAATAHER